MKVPSMLLAAASLVWAQCPFMSGMMNGNHTGFNGQSDEQFFRQFYLDDHDTYMTTDVGGPIEDQQSLSVGERGPTLLEDFIFRQKIQHFDHERVPERAVHARGTGAHGVFTSYGDWSNITGADFLSAKGKKTPIFIRFSTVAGSRGSGDTARDVHGFAVRFYTDEGNFAIELTQSSDIVGNNIPVFFIQDAIQFPDLIHAVKPMPHNEIPQAATAHDSAWDFFSQQPSSLHTLFWAMSGHGIPRSFRHVDGFGVHTYRLVTDKGESKLVKFHFKTQQGLAGLVWEEAQAIMGKNPDYHRQDLHDAIEAGNYPEWEFGVQVMDESDELKYGFDLLDPTKIVPEDLVPITPLGKLKLNRNPRNYFAETEQIMFQPGHIVRGVDFTDDPLLQGRLFSYLDTQLNRHGGPNFEQLPINRPRVHIHNNNRDGAAQVFIPLNEAAYSPNTLNKGSPKQANQTDGKGFFTTPGRKATGGLQRTLSSTFNDVWSQPRLFWNSLGKTEKQFLVNAMRFETSKVSSEVVKENVLIQLNRVSHDLASRVAKALGLKAPKADPKYYHNNKTINLGTFGQPLRKLDGLSIGILSSATSLYDAAALKKILYDANDKVNVDVVAEYLTNNTVTMTYSNSDATNFDAVIAMEAAYKLIKEDNSALYPAGRPLQIVVDAYRYGKAVGFVGHNVKQVLDQGIGKFVIGAGVIEGAEPDHKFAHHILDALKTFKFLDRFFVDEDSRE
ncbi:hypothetical protein KEM54_005164 [Ascosphaera aggregata]|nr:hypothetical protein KEM54_005164 [Ascosphaera aggregata]